MPEGSGLYDVVFRGEIVEGFCADAVKEQLARVLKADRARVDRLFTGGPVTIRRAVDCDTARKYVLAFRKAGAICSMVVSTREPMVSVREPAEQYAAEHLSSGGFQRTEVQETDPQGTEVRRAEARRTEIQGTEAGEPDRSDITDTMKCPKCGHLQAWQPECVRCGIIIGKYRPVPIPKPSAGRSSLTIYRNDRAESRRRLTLLLCLVAILGFVVHKFWIGNEIRHPPGVIVNSEPSQVMPVNLKSWSKGNRIIVPLALFSLGARVLGKENYSLDAMADISPIDLALGWGPMSDQRIVDRLNIVQGSRRFMVSCDSRDCPPIPVHALMGCSSNMHMIPAGREIEKELDSLRAGDIVDIKGYLVGVQENGQWVWFSSLSRTDTGHGACEIIWVEEVRVHPPPMVN